MRFRHARDQDLLLLLHGALPPLRRTLTEAHLRRCPQCRHRRQQLTRVSQALADTIRDPSDSPWRLPAPRRPFPLGTLITATLLLALTLTLFLGTQRARHAPSAASYSGGCRPDLPNDRCR